MFPGCERTSQVPLPAQVVAIENLAMIGSPLRLQQLIELFSLGCSGSCNDGIVCRRKCNNDAYKSMDGCMQKMSIPFTVLQFVCTPKEVLWIKCETLTRLNIKNPSLRTAAGRLAPSPPCGTTVIS